MSMETETMTKSTTADEVIRRNLDKLRREMGATIQQDTHKSIPQIVRAFG